MSLWNDFMNTIRGTLRPEPERKEGPAVVVDDSENRILTPDAEIPRRTSHYERGWDAAWEQGEFAGKGMINETPYSPGSDGESEFFEGYYDGLAVRDNTEEPRRRENGNEPLTPDYDPKRGPRC